MMLHGQSQPLGHAGAMTGANGIIRWAAMGEGSRQDNACAWTDSHDHIGLVWRGGKE
jgi:hypothetical protein